MKRTILALGTLTLLAFVLSLVAGSVMAKTEYSDRSGHPGDCYYCHDEDQGYPTATSLNETGRAYRAEGHPEATAEDPWEPTATGDQYGTHWDGASPIEDPLGNTLSIERMLREESSGIGIIGGAMGGEKGGFVNTDIGPILESQTRGSTQACTKPGCHQEYVDQDHYMNMRPASGTDCYACHTKHVACSVCHELGKGGDSVTRVANGRLNAFGVPLELPPVIDDALREVPLIDAHKAIAHGGLIAEYAPGDLGAIFDTTRALTGDDESHYLAGTIRETDSTLQDETMWKLDELPVIGVQQANPQSASATPAASPLPVIELPVVGPLPDLLGGALDPVTGLGLLNGL